MGEGDLLDEAWLRVHATSEGAALTARGRFAIGDRVRRDSGCETVDGCLYWERDAVSS